MRLRTTLHLASFFPILTTALFIAYLFTVHLTVVAPGGGATGLPTTGATLMAVFSLLVGWAFYRAGGNLVKQVGTLEQMAERVKQGDLDPADLPRAAKGEVAEVTEVFSELIVELRGYVQLIRSHEELKRKYNDALAAAEQLRESAVPVSGAFELLRRAEQSIITRMLDRESFVSMWLPPGAMRQVVSASADTPEKGTDASEMPPHIRDLLQTLINGTMDATGADGVGSAPENVSIRDALGDALCLCRWNWERERPGAPIDVKIVARDDKPCDVPVDRFDLVQTFVPILANAGEAMPEGGSITIDIGTEVGGAATMSITDTGPGMSETVQSRCMKPFFSTKEGRLGVGLSVASRLVARSGGRLGIIGAPGKGATVHISFPRHRVQARAPGGSAAQGEPLGILLVEDDEATRQTMVAMLLKDGHRVTDVEDGAAAVLRLRRERFDVVLTDRAMPIMSGEELALVVKLRHPSTPVVMVTGTGEEMTRRHMRPEGVDVILPKPVLRDDLRLALAQAMQQAETGDQAQ